MKKIKRTKKKSEWYIKRLQRREEERNTICIHWYPLLKCRTCVKEIQLKRHPNTVFIQWN